MEIFLQCLKLIEFLKLRFCNDYGFEVNGKSFVIHLAPPIVLDFKSFSFGFKCRITYN